VDCLSVVADDGWLSEREFNQGGTAELMARLQTCACAFSSSHRLLLDLKAAHTLCPPHPTPTITTAKSSSSTPEP
jgi:hypothetical protein